MRSILVVCFLVILLHVATCKPTVRRRRFDFGDWVKGAAADVKSGFKTAVDKTKSGLSKAGSAIKNKFNDIFDKRNEKRWVDWRWGDSSEDSDWWNDNDDDTLDDFFDWRK